MSSPVDNFGGIFPPANPLATFTAEDVTPEIAQILALKPSSTLESRTAELLKTCATWLRRYVALSGSQDVILAAWVLHTHVFDASEYTPYIHITAPEKACGKSRLMETLAAIAYKPVRSGGMTAAALVRLIDRNAPTVFLDEMDAQLGGDKEYAEALRGILNEGFRKGAVFYKCEGRTHELREFSVYSPKCFAGIGRIPDTVASRSIAIEMRRKLPGETVEPFRQRDVESAALPIRRNLEEWREEAVNRLHVIRPKPIEGIADRQNDVAEPLLAVAQLGGPEWLQRLTQAFHEIFSGRDSEDVSPTVMLLSDIRDAFDDKRTDQITSSSLVEYLVAIEGHPWTEWYHGKPMTASSLARQLAKHGVKPAVIRFGSETLRGYRRGEFEDKWIRYCPVACPVVQRPQQTQHPASLLGKNARDDRKIVATEDTTAATLPANVSSPCLLPDQEVEI